MSKQPKTISSRSGQFTLGRKGMDKLNAVEGIRLPRAAREMFADFDRNGASAEERRRAIIDKYARKA